jgi:hypothetical protein
MGASNNNETFYPAHENPTEFDLTFSYDGNRQFVKLAGTDAEKISEDSQDLIFHADSEFEIFSIAGYNSHLATQNDIIVEDSSGQTLGILCLSCSDIGFELNAMTIARYIGYISDCSRIDIVNVDKYHTFKKSYLLIKKELSEEYRTSHLNTAALWGGFTHAENTDSYRDPTEISLVASSNIIFPTAEHQQKLNNAILSENGFDRFLKKYQLLELVFDYVCVMKLRTISNSLIGFRDVMGDYSKDDIINLKSLLTEYIDDISALVPSLHIARSHQPLVKNIFQAHSKSSNPLKESSKWDIFWERLELHDLGYTQNSSNKFSRYTNEVEYNSEILKIISYWIYRIRCSIAHNKIGEFIFEDSHEEFVVQVGEKLLDTIIELVFSNPRFIRLVDASKAVDMAISEPIP